MLMPGKATANGRPNLHVLAIGAVCVFAFGAALFFYFFFSYARGMICDENALLIFFVENTRAVLLHWNLTGDTN